MTARILRASGSDDNPDKLLQEAQVLFSQGHARRKSDPQTAEKNFRKALELLRDSYLLAKNQKTLKLLHRYGKAVHETFRCRFPFQDGAYEQSCPVFLSHLKHGVSPGISGTEVCSICESNMLDCEHVKGWIYDHVPARRIKDVCNICRGKEHCAHEPGKPYGPVMAFAFMTDLRADHIAIVENPKDPLASIMSRTLDKEEILESLPEREKAFFEYGKTTLYCHHCLGCKG